ncbi:alanine racemase, partial [Butyricicoccus sp. 1XD8-22]
VGEKVILIGKHNEEEITIDEWAAKVETINYEIPCIITTRVPRIYYS